MILDTNILIAYLNGDLKVIRAVSDWKQSGRVLFISSISRAETLSLPRMSQEDAYTVRKFLDNFLSIPFDDNLAEATAILRQTYQLKLPDAAIAATALTRSVPLVTRDRQFRKI